MFLTTEQIAQRFGVERRPRMSICARQRPDGKR